MKLAALLCLALVATAFAQTPPLTIGYVTTAGSPTVQIVASWTPFPPATCAGTIAYDLWYSTSFGAERTQATQPSAAGSPISTTIQVGIDPTFWVVRQHCIGQATGLPYRGSTNTTALCLSCPGGPTAVQRVLHR